MTPTPADDLPEGEGPAASADCRQPEDFYTPQARDTIARLFRRFLDETALTATELLHSPRHQTGLSNTPTFPAVLQQAERAMERKGTLAPLVNEVARLTRERVKDQPLPDLRPDSYATVAADLLGDDGQGVFRLEAALTQYLFNGRNFADKAGLLLDLAAEAAEAGALAPIERLLGEILASEAGTASCAPNAGFKELVDLIVTLVAADRPLAEEAPPVFRRIEALMRRSPMPVLTDKLMVALRRELSKPHCFTIGSAGDLFGIESVQREIMALSDLSARVRTGTGYIGGPKTEAALQRRSALLVNEDTVPEITKGRTLIQKLRILFVLQKMPLSPSAGRAVNDYLKSFFDSRDFAGRLLDCWKERNDRLKGLAEVQKLVLTSAFSEDDREWMAQQMDEMQNAFLRTQRVLAPFQGSADPSADSVVELVRLAADGAFCTGKSRLAAGRVLYRQVHRPRFVRSFLLGAHAGRERAARASWLRQSLAAVGVPFIDLGGLRVLAVDDEEGPRRFVASVLQELGVGRIDTASDGQEALERIAADRDGGYHLIVCDWMMPRLSGLELLKRVRERSSDLPFLMVTALATLKAVEQALAHHVSAYIAKPFTPDQLEEKIFLVLAQRNAE